MTATCLYDWSLDTHLDGSEMPKRMETTSIQKWVGYQILRWDTLIHAIPVGYY